MLSHLTFLSGLLARLSWVYRYGLESLDSVDPEKLSPRCSLRCEGQWSGRLNRSNARKFRSKLGSFEVPLELTDFQFKIVLLCQESWSPMAAHSIEMQYRVRTPTWRKAKEASLSREDSLER